MSHSTTHNYLVLQVNSTRLQAGSKVVLRTGPKVLFPPMLGVGNRSKALVGSRWNCDLAWVDEWTVSISLKLLNAQSEHTYPDFKFLHFAANDDVSESQVLNVRGSPSLHNPFPSIMRGGEYTLSVNLESIIDKNDSTKFAINLVLSMSENLPAVLLVNPDPVISEKPSVNKSLKEIFPEVHQSMLRLLKDPGSVNVGFVFTIHNCQRKVALWANRTLLDKYPRFQEVFGVVVDNSPALIPIEGISLTTFCILLKHLYTGDLDLIVEPSEFLICDMNHLKEEPSMGSVSSLAVLNKSLKEHNAAQFYATWNVKDKVAWADLFLAADRFEVANLRKQCLNNLLESVNSNNALEILFGVGMRFKEEIRNPVMEYISEHLDDIFSIQTHDPFKRFSDHEGCHEVMLELLRLERSK